MFHLKSLQSNFGFRWCILLTIIIVVSVIFIFCVPSTFMNWNNYIILYERVFSLQSLQHICIYLFICLLILYWCGFMTLDFIIQYYLYFLAQLFSF